MRACGFGVLLGVLVLGVGCETNNYYDCQAVDDGGVCMRYAPAGDHWGDDQLLDPGEVRRNDTIFRATDELQGSANLTLDEPAQTLLDVATKDGVPRLLTISFGNDSIINAPAVGTSPDSEIVAYLDVGLGGLNFIVELDMIRGQQFSFAASRVKLSARYQRMPGAGAVPVPAPIWKVGAAIAHGVVAHGMQPQRTYGNTGVLAAGVGVSWPVPPFASAFLVMANPNTVVIRANLQDPFAATIASFTVAASPSPEWPLTSDTWAVQVFNAGAAAFAGHRIVYKLSF